MADDRVKAWLEADFQPVGAGVATEIRAAAALEHMAYRLCLIDKKLARLIEAGESKPK